MAKSIPAIVTPEILQWARNLDMISVDEISKKLKVPTDNKDIRHMQRDWSRRNFSK